MNGIWFRALLVTLLTASPIAVATAQEAPPAEENKVDETEEEKKKKAEEDAKKEAPAEEPKPAEQPNPAEQPKEEPKPAETPTPAEQPKEEPKPVETPAPAETPAAADQPAAKDEPKAEEAPAPAATPIEQKAPDAEGTPGDDTVASPQITATAESKPDAAAGKPWKVTADLSFSVGAAFLNANSDLQRPSLAWALDMIGTYTTTKLLEGNLDVFGRVSMDQVLTNTVFESAVGQTKQYEFFFRDVRLGLTAPNLFKEKITGITISPSTEFFLPTSKGSIAAERWVRWGLNLKLGRTFEKLGPGDLALNLGSVFRKDFSARHVHPDAHLEASNLCRSYSIEADIPELAQLNRTDCGSLRNSNFSFINDVGVSYTWGPVTAGISFAIYSIRYHRGDLGPTPPGLVVGESPNASDNTWTNLTLASLSASYTINDNWSLGLSVTTYQSPYIYADGSNSKLRFPFFDTASNAENLTTFDLGVTFVY